MKLSLLNWPLLAVATLLCGCGQGGVELAEVTGKVTLDGKIVENAEVELIPKSGNRVPSYGVTDSNGVYRMQFTNERWGAMLGPSLVKIRSLEPITVGGQNLGIREVFDKRYNNYATLERTVEPGENVFDFECTSDK